MDLEFFPHGTGCFKFVSAKTENYSDAYAKCKAFKTDEFSYAGLATIWDLYDNEFLHSKIIETSVSNKSYWLGLKTSESIIKSETQKI